MHLFGLILYGFVASFWIFYGLYIAYGASRLPIIKDIAPASDSECPRISILLAARDEEEKLPAALATLMEINYPNLEVIAVDDRSQDSTGQILDEFAATHSRLRVVHVAQLPAGWLGKPHALQKAYEAATGEWLLFTDADVHFKPDVLRRAVAFAKQQDLDHLSLFCDVEMVGFWEMALITFFVAVFHLATNPRLVGNHGSPFYVGIGAFQLLKRSTYEACGTHRRLAMEVIDDMKLGKVVKRSGFHSGVVIAQDSVVVRWHDGIGNLTRGVTKNFFAAFGYNLGFVAAGISSLLLLNVAPFLGIIFGHGWIRIFAAIALVIAICFYGGTAASMRVSPLYSLTYPLGAVLLSYMLLRSAVVTLKQGGIVWRDTFYPLDELKRGIV
jgi:glycosyltransferase involved in cell wall biosynthesis